MTADRDLGPGLREAAADGVADAAVAAGHKRDLAVEPKELLERYHRAHSFSDRTQRTQRTLKARGRIRIAISCLNLRSSVSSVVERLRRSFRHKALATRFSLRLDDRDRADGSRGRAAPFDREHADGERVV